MLEKSLGLGHKLLGSATFQAASAERCASLRCQGPGAVDAAHRSSAAGCLDKMGHHEVWNSHNNTHSKGGRGW